MSAGSLKCVIVGDGGVGKTCMLVSYATNRFPIDHIPTVFDNYAVTVEAGASTYFLQLFDTAGQEEYDRLRLLAYPGTDVFLVCFSLTSNTSLENVSATWFPELEKYNAPKILVGLQQDLRGDAAAEARLATKGQSPVSQEQGRRAARKLRAHAYVECSALTQAGLKDVFDTAMLSILEPRAQNKRGKLQRLRRKLCLA